jgi:hypothetical protein
MSGLSVKRVSEIGQSPPQKWLVESLWTQQAVGFVAGHPKTNKSWLALDFAVSVASGTAVLDRFSVHDPGPVLIFPAEDAPTEVRDRMAGICRHRNVDFDTLDVWLIDSYALRLDSPADCEALENIICERRPRLLILDPLIRLHSADENSATEIARILSFLRGLQRQYATAVLLVHHARKCASSDPGLGLRGSTEIRAWSDVNLYMRKAKDLTLLAEHRAARCPDPAKLVLVCEDENAVHLAIEDTTLQRKCPLKERVIETLSHYDDGPLTREQIRSEVGARNQTVGEVLQGLVDENVVERTTDGYRLSQTDPF